VADVMNAPKRPKSFLELARIGRHSNTLRPEVSRQMPAQNG
jgi:hypothetical protein